MSYCEHCGKEREVSMSTGLFEDGHRGEIYLCDECYLMFLSSDSWFSTVKGNVKNTKSSIKRDISSNNDITTPANHVISEEKNDFNTWTALAKAINLIAFVCFGFMGMIIGGMLIENIGWLVGGLVGVIIGGVTISFSMVIIEISQKLSVLIEVIKNRKL